MFIFIVDSIILLSSNILPDKQLEDAHSLNKVKEQLQINVHVSQTPEFFFRFPCFHRFL